MRACSLSIIHWHRLRCLEAPARRYNSQFSNLKSQLEPKRLILLAKLLYFSLLANFFAKKTPFLVEIGSFFIAFPFI